MIKAEYVDHMGSDLTVVNSARVSFDKESEWIEESYDENNRLNTGIKQLGPHDCRLINYLAKHGHFTPFTHPQIAIRETVPIFVARQRFKHVVGFTYNETSRRYVDDEPSFYFPDEWRSRPEGSVKQGSGSEIISDSRVIAGYKQCVSDCLDQYELMLSIGVAPEQARMVLPQSMMTSYYVTGSLAAFARAYKQRIDSHAQIEIQELAKQWSELISPLYPVSWSALTNE